MSARSPEGATVLLDNFEGVMEEGDVLASQTWAGGSWSQVIEYEGRYFSVNEVETTECSSILEAFISAAIGNDTFDRIDSLHIKNGYEQYLTTRS